MTTPETPIQITKMSVLLPISDEMLYGPLSSRPGHTEPPTAEEIAAYRAWKAKFEPLYQEGYDKGWFSPGGPDFGFEYEPPTDSWVYDDEGEQ